MVIQQTTDVETRPHQVPFSTLLYGIDWAKYFPYTIPGTKIEVEYSVIDEALEFMAREAEQILECKPNIILQSESVLEKKNRYHKLVSDSFLIYDENVPIGVFFFNPLDWSTYYLRTGGLLPRYQNQRIWQKFLGYVLDILEQNGIARIEAEVSPGNLAQIHVLNKFEFNIVGTKCSDRWGTVLNFVKYLNPQNEEVFIRKFCYGISPQLSRGGRNFI